MPCFFHELTGFYCPGCGGTRAFFALITGHPIISFLYNPAVIYAAGVLLFYAVWGVLYAISRRSKKETGDGSLSPFSPTLSPPKFHLAFVWIFIAILMVNCTVKNLMLYFTQVSPSRGLL